MVCRCWPMLYGCWRCNAMAYNCICNRIDCVSLKLNYDGQYVNDGHVAQCVCVCGHKHAWTRVGQACAEVVDWTMTYERIAANCCRFTNSQCLGTDTACLIILWEPEIVGHIFFLFFVGTILLLNDVHPFFHFILFEYLILHIVVLVDTILLFNLIFFVHYLNVKIIMLSTTHPNQQDTISADLCWIMYRKVEHTNLNVGGKLTNVIFCNLYSIGILINKQTNAFVTSGKWQSDKNKNNQAKNAFNL